MEIDFFKDIPIFIISFNRLSYLQRQVDFLEKAGYQNIHIIDNASFYPPLLDYLAKSKHTVHRLTKNYGHLVLFVAPEFKDIIENQYFVLTDNDVIPNEDCPNDFVEFFYKTLSKHKNVNKVGFSLRIDDLPDCYALKNAVIKWESPFYQKPIKNSSPVLYNAPIDTTFALYRPKKDWKKNKEDGIRTGVPYQARHLPFYKDLDNLTDEDIFYNNSDKQCGNWNGTKTSDFFQVTERSYIKVLGVPVMKIKKKKTY
ncbi:MAG: hypothetical protein MJ210_05840, partial [Alphaproteobacteria bacterium]|nr:hypothetical protein [Alphaproteobacteria bacterium]